MKQSWENHSSSLVISINVHETAEKLYFRRATNLNFVKYVNVMFIFSKHCSVEVHGMND